MSNVVYKGKGQVPLYRIYRHSITPWGAQEGWGDNIFPGNSSSPSNGSTEGRAAKGTSASASAQSRFLSYPQLLIKSPMS